MQESRTIGHDKTWMQGASHSIQERIMLKLKDQTTKKGRLPTKYGPRLNWINISVNAC